MQVSNEWFIGESESNQGKIITRGRTHLDNIRNSGQFSMRAEIQWIYKGNKDGMPTDHEAEIIDHIMNLLTGELEKQPVAVMTAMHTGAGQALYVFYVSNIDEMSEIIDTTLSRFPPLPVKIGVIRDTEWTDYTTMISKFVTSNL